MSEKIILLLQELLADQNRKEVRICIADSRG